MPAKTSDEFQFSDLFQRLPAEEQKKLLAHMMTVIRRYQSGSNANAADLLQKNAGKT